MGFLAGFPLQKFYVHGIPERIPKKKTLDRAGVVRAMEAIAEDALQDDALRGRLAQLERDLEETRREKALGLAHAARVQASATRYKAMFESVTAERDAASHAVLVRPPSSSPSCRRY